MEGKNKATFSVVELELAGEAHFESYRAWVRCLPAILS